jgi:hypothetical protein
MSKRGFLPVSGGNDKKGEGVYEPMTPARKPNLGSGLIFLSIYEYGHKLTDD